MVKKIAYALLALLAVACGGKQQADDQQTADPDDAVARGHEAAWAVAHTDHTDTIAQYVLTGEDEAATDFEQAFADSLRRIDPQLARQIFGN